MGKITPKDRVIDREDCEIRAIMPGDDWIPIQVPGPTEVPSPTIPIVPPPAADLETQRREYVSSIPWDALPIPSIAAGVADEGRPDIEITPGDVIRTVMEQPPKVTIGDLDANFVAPLAQRIHRDFNEGTMGMEFVEARPGPRGAAGLLAGSVPYDRGSETHLNNEDAFGVATFWVKDLETGETVRVRTAVVADGVGSTSLARLSSQHLGDALLRNIVSHVLTHSLIDSIVDGVSISHGLKIPEDLIEILAESYAISDERLHAISLEHILEYYEASLREAGTISEQMIPDIIQGLRENPRNLTSSTLFCAMLIDRPGTPGSNSTLLYLPLGDCSLNVVDPSGSAKLTVDDYDTSAPPQINLMDEPRSAAEYEEMVVQVEIDGSSNGQSLELLLLSDFAQKRAGKEDEIMAGMLSANGGDSLLGEFGKLGELDDDSTVIRV